MLLFLNYKIDMNIKRILAALLAFVLAGCVINQPLPMPTFNTHQHAYVSQPKPAIESHPYLILPNPHLLRLQRRLLGFAWQAGEKAFFNGDYLLAQSEFQAALSSTTDPETRAAALWGLGRVEYAAGNNGKALDRFGKSGQ